MFDPPLNIYTYDYQHSSVYMAIERWISQMGTLRHTFVRGLKGFATHHGGTFDWCSGCSGSDLYSKVLRDFSNYIHDTFSIHLSFTTKFACDNDRKVQKFLVSEFTAQDLPSVYDDLANLKESRAKNIRSGSRELVKYANGFAVGFSCLSKTPLNSKRSTTTFCLQDPSSTESTTVTYRLSKAWLVKTRPKFAILENLATLDQKDVHDVDAVSDGEFIINDLRSADFAVIAINLNVKDYGSWPKRIRKHFIVMAGNTNANMHTLGLSRQFLEAMKGSWRQTAEDVLWSEERRMQFLRPMGKPTPESRNRPQGGQWEDEHRVLFEHADMKWPPVLASAAGLSYEHMRDGRMKECAFFYFQHFGTAPEYMGKWQAVDLHPTISRGVGLGVNIKRVDECLEGVVLKDPWSKGGDLPTITGTSRFLLRYKHSPDHQPVGRMLLGAEAMQAMGWDSTYWHEEELPDDAPRFDNELLGTMAGRAFSGFAFTPVAASIIAAIGVSLTHQADHASSAGDVPLSQESRHSTQDFFDMVPDATIAGGEDDANSSSESD
jgi:site-specific DNA-cytosine methylase